MVLSAQDQLAGDALIEIYQLHTPAGILFFTPYETVVFGGFTYTGYPIQSEGYDKMTDGKLPTPSITLSNRNGYVTALLQLYGDLINAQVYRFFVYRRNLDDGTNPDPTAFSAGDLFYLNYYTADEYAVTLHLRSVLEIGKLELPRRRLSELLV